VNKVETEEFAVMKNEITHIKNSVDCINAKLDNLDQKYAPKYTLILAVSSFVAAMAIIATLIASMI
jgi:hypothetical protein